MNSEQKRVGNGIVLSINNQKDGKTSVKKSYKRKMDMKDTERILNQIRFLENEMLMFSFIRDYLNHSRGELVEFLFNNKGMNITQAKSMAKSILVFIEAYPM